MSDRATALTHAFVTEAFEYKDGRLIWRHRPTHHFVDEWRQKIFNSRQAGSEAGSPTSGYLMVRFSFGKIGVHRLIYLLHHGSLPAVVDHIDGNPLNNRIENLRAANHAANIKNMKTPTSNTSGVKGVSFHKGVGKWVAGIRADGRWKHLGSFSSIHEAEAARKAAEQVHYGEFANGR